MPNTPMSPLYPPEHDGKRWFGPDMGLLEGIMKILYYGTTNGYVVTLIYDMKDRSKNPVLSVYRVDGFLDIKQNATIISFPKTVEGNGGATEITESIFEIDDLAKANEYVDKAKALPKAKERLESGDHWIRGLYPTIIFQ